MTDKLRDNRIRWYGYVLRRPVNALIKKIKALQVRSQKRKKIRLFPKCFTETLYNDIVELGSLLALDKAT